MDAPIYTAEGKKNGSISLPESVFGVAWNDSLMYQVVRSMQSNARTRIAHTKNRGDVRGGGKKPWRQKGTGRARHGSIRSPIWRGGGVAHGPRNEKIYTLEIPKKMRAKALFMALSRKLRDGEVIFVDSLGLSSPKTAAAKKILTSLSKAGFEKLGTKKNNVALIALWGEGDGAKKSFRNIGSVATSSARELNPVSVLGNTYLIIENPNESLKIVEARVKQEDRTGNQVIYGTLQRKKESRNNEAAGSHRADSNALCTRSRGRTSC